MPFQQCTTVPCKRCLHQHVAIQSKLNLMHRSSTTGYICEGKCYLTVFEKHFWGNLYQTVNVATMVQMRTNGFGGVVWEYKELF